jgi:RNA polymerase sigma factor (sigma-70 family)
VKRRGLTDAGLRARMRFAGDDQLTSAVRRGDRRAFEAVYDRYSSELLRFGVFMLGSQQDAEDAVQATFTAAYRALLADSRPIALRPWLFTITRNECVSIQRSRRQTVELNGELAVTDDPVHHVEVDEELRQMLAAMRELPEQQRAALVLAEAHGLTHPEIAEVLGVDTKQIKAFVYQARANLLADRRAREAPCEEIREQLAAARGPLLLQGRLRRHLRSCPGCREYADDLARQRRRLHAALPFIPSVALKHRAIEGALGLGGAGSGTYAGATAVGASIAGFAEVAGGLNALIVKVVAGAVVLSATAGVGVSVVRATHPAHARASSAAASAATGTTRLASMVQPRSQRSVPLVPRHAQKEHENRSPTNGPLPPSHPSAQPPRTARRESASTGPSQGSAIKTTGNGASTAHAGSQPQQSHGTSGKTEAERQEKTSEREAAREQPPKAHEQHQGKHEEHAAPPAKTEPHGPEEHHPEGVAKGPPTEEAQRQKQEAQEAKKEEHKLGHSE